MPTATYAKYTAAIEPMLEGMNAGSDSWKIALAATVNIADTTFTAGTTDLATAGVIRLAVTRLRLLAPHKLPGRISWCWLARLLGRLRVLVLPSGMR